MTTSSPSTAPTPPSPLAMHTSKIAGVTLAVFLGAGLLSCGWLVAKGSFSLLPEKPMSDDAVIHGEITHRIAKELANAPLPLQAANLERAGSWLVFADTGPRVRQGCPGWLFLADEFKLNRHAQDNAKAKAEAVVALQQSLKKRGIELLVSVVPDKSRIAASQLCALYRPVSLEARVQDWTAGLKAAGVATLDLAPAVRPLGAEAYLRTDTHWSEAGAKAAAGAIAGQVKALGIAATPQKGFDVSQEPKAVRPGDLVRLAGLDWLPLHLQPATEEVAPSKISEHVAEASTGGDSLDDLFGDDNLPNVALIGTSFSRNSNFAGFLQQSLGAVIGNFAKDGGEFSGAAKAYFESPAFTQTPPKLVIWEIPERDLQTVYAGDVKLD
ncbi:alginate O-acetyltransferase AlgX-related protein [Pseudomonas sp. NY15354]|uniref:alginate O-acetyltransferase AlgX-related protein n=1 Tax=Pseudomonas sp. NY15354 TaxID=3400351 RepID=UPI003A86670A